MTPAIMLVVGILAGEVTPPEPPEPPPAAHLSGGGRTAVRINGRLYVGSDLEIARMVHDLADQQAIEQQPQPSKKATKRAARRAARQTQPDVQVVALDAPQGPTIDELMARNALIQAQVRAIYAQRLAATMLAIHMQIQRHNEEAATTAALMIL